MQSKLNPINDAKISFPGFQRILDFTVPTVDTYTKLLLHMDGANGGTTFNDEAGHAATVANATTSTTKYKFGSTSGYFNGSSAYVTFADSADWALYGADFTIDFWINPSTQTGTNGELVVQRNTGSLTYGTYFYINNSGVISFQSWVNNVKQVDLTSASSAVSVNTNTWQHIALVRYGNAWNIYVNGTSVASATNSWAGYDYTDPLTIGVDVLNGGAVNYYTGYMDEVRISKGIARWTSNFTPPTSAYTDVYSSVSVTVDGDTDKEYKILINNPSTGAQINLRLNSDSGTNYGYQYLLNNAGSISAARSSSTNMIYCPATTKTLTVYTLLTPSGMVKTGFEEHGWWSSGTTISVNYYYGFVWNSTANVTTLAFSANSGNFASGTRITVYARRG